MKIKEGFKLRKIGKDHIVVAEGLKTVNFNKMIVLNETAVYLWEAVQGKDWTPSSLADLLLEKYDVDPETAAADASALADKWVEAGLVD